MGELMPEPKPEPDGNAARACLFGVAVSTVFFWGPLAWILFT